MLKIIAATHRLFFSKESTPYFQNIPFLVNLLNFEAILSVLHDAMTKQ